MQIYRVKSLSYRDYVVQGPSNSDLSALEEEWAKTLEGGTVPEFVLWLVETKGFEPVEGTIYTFSRG